MADAPSTAASAAAFLDWTLGQPDSRRWELWDGRIVEAPLDPVAEIARADAVLSLRRAARLAGLRSTVFAAGAPVVIEDRTVLSPAVVVGDGGAMSARVVRADAPTLVVDVLGSEPGPVDGARRLSAYADARGVEQVLVLDPIRKRVTLHTRRAEGVFLSLVKRDGVIEIDPPGLSLPVSDLFLSR